MVKIQSLLTLISAHPDNPEIAILGALANYVLPAAGDPHGKFWDSLKASKKFWGYFYNVFGFLMRIYPFAWVYCAFLIGL